MKSKLQNGLVRKSLHVSTVTDNDKPNRGVQFNFAGIGRNSNSGKECHISVAQWLFEPYGNISKSEYEPNGINLNPHSTRIQKRLNQLIYPPSGESLLQPLGQIAQWSRSFTNMNMFSLYTGGEQYRSDISWSFVRQTGKIIPFDHQLNLSLSVIGSSGLTSLNKIRVVTLNPVRVFTENSTLKTISADAQKALNNTLTPAEISQIDRAAGEWIRICRQLTAWFETVFLPAVDGAL